jgi:tetratricopeptide (TPR) repeat protein
MGRNEEALQAYDKAIEVNPIFGDAWRGRGEALKALGKVYDASMSFYMAQKLGYEEE